MKNENLNKELDVIGKYMVSQIRREMTSRKLKASGELYNSVSHFVDDNELNIESLDYGSVILGEGSMPSTKSPSNEMVNRIQRWMSYKQMQPIARGRGGRFRKRTPSAMRSSAWNLSKRILERGVKSSNIIQNSVMKLEKRIEKDIVDAYKQDIIENIDIEQINKNIIKINK